MALNDRTLPLENGEDWQLFVNDRRVLVHSKSKIGWTSISSAVLNGGLQRLPSGAPGQVLNAKVPANYDGVNPDPKQLLKQLVDPAKNQKGDDDDSNIDPSEQETTTTDCATTIGLLTAASMKTLSVASQSATSECGQTCRVDAIVTAGISNARMAGADTDVFHFRQPDSNNAVEKRDADSTNKEEEEATTQFGTINTIVLCNMALEESTALVEAYAVAIEAKCRAVTELGIHCAKHPLDGLATGTGTDSSVLICPNTNTDNLKIVYAGKHTLAGELLGQAVYQATKEAIEANLNEFYRGRSPILSYRLRCYKSKLICAVMEGHRPLVPSQPMTPIPTPKGWVLMVGLMGILLIVVIRTLATMQVDSTGQCQQLLITILFWKVSTVHERSLGGSMG